MSFAIEVPGDANPLSPQTLCRVLEWATSNNNSQRQEAGSQLKSWELQTGYYAALQVRSGGVFPKFVSDC